MQGIAGLLPADVLLKIFTYCSYTDLLRFQFVCRWWQQVSRDKHLWRDIVYKPGRTDSSKEIIDNLKVSPELRALNLKDVADSAVTEELVQELVNGCPRLEKLTVSWVCLNEKINLEVKKIKFLFVEGVVSYSGVNFGYLHNYFPNIEHLECSSLSFPGSDPGACFRKCPVGSHCERHYSNCILPYLSECRNLKSLSLLSPRIRNGRLPGQPVEYVEQISSLTIRYSVGTVMIHFFPYFPKLVAIHLDHCFVRGAQALLVAAENCPLLERLTLSSCSFRDHDLKYVSNFRKLTFLCLRSNHCITDACVAHFQAILELRHLDVSACSGLTPQCLLALCSFEKLQSLKFDLQNCDPPADLGANHVKNPDLHIMFYNCKDTSVLDRLRPQRLRISLLKECSV